MKSEKKEETMRKVDEVALQNEQVRFSPPGDPGRTPNIEVGQAGVPFVGVVSVPIRTVVCLHILSLLVQSS